MNTAPVLKQSDWYLVVLGQKKAVLGQYWYWLIHDGTGSVWGDTCWYLVVLDQQRAVMVDT